MSQSSMTTGNGRPRALGSTAYTKLTTDDCCPSCGRDDPYHHHRTLFESPNHDYCDACDYYQTYHGDSENQ